MVEFMTGYTAPMDRQFDAREIAPTVERGISNIEQEIIPISEIGTTTIDAGGGNILSNLDKSIRIGTKKVQLVLFGGQNGSPSALASSYGKDVRQEIREKAKSAGVEIVGVELSPQRIAGLSGFNQQNNTISEEQRQQELRQVKDAIKFAADVAGGGNVDVWSNEFNRTIYGSKWNKDKDGNPMFFDYSPKELDKDGIKNSQLVKYLVDKRTGRFIQESVVRTNDKIHRVEFERAEDRGLVNTKDRNGRTLKKGDYIDFEGNFVDKYDEGAVERLVPRINSKTKQYDMETIDWDILKKETEEFNKSPHRKGEELSVEEYAFRQKMLNQKALLKGQSLYYGRDLDFQQQQVRDLVEMRKFAEKIEGGMSKEEQRRWIEDNAIRLLGGRGEIPNSFREEILKKKPSEALNEAIQRSENFLRGMQEQVRSYRANEAEIDEIMRNVKTMDKFAKEKVFDSYKEAGKYAMQVTKDQKLKKPVYVGPEIGWAGESYGGHPQEFKEIVLESRKLMAEDLKRSGYTESEAKEKAKMHIKGMLDTSHMSMWYKHFAQKPGESEDKKLERFKEWMKTEVVDLVKAGVVGGVQVVDSMTGEHAHLPAGQGIFDMVKLVQEMKKAGFDGPIISEGHEEDQFNQGRILTATWGAFGSPIGNVSPGQRGGLRTWGGTQSSYFGYVSPTLHIVGAYVPSNDWQLWSETPFE